MNSRLTDDQLRKAIKTRFKLLQRYDIEWYRENFPAPTAVGRRKETLEHMGEIDLKLSKQVARMIRILIDEEGVGMPTQGDVLARCRASDLFLKHRDRLPQTVAVLAPLAA